MPVYYFNLWDNRGVLVDPEGTELSDERQALEHARQVARELMQNRESETRAWRLQVCDAQRDAAFELRFVALDCELQCVRPFLRETLELGLERMAGFSDAISEIRTSLYRIRATLAKSNGAPHLVAIDGSRIEP